MPLAEVQLTFPAPLVFTVTNLKLATPPGPVKNKLDRILPVDKMMFVLEIMFAVLEGNVLPPSKEITEQSASPITNVLLPFSATQKNLYV
jgi:hypothetical protein